MSVIRIKDISHVRFSAPDLGAMADFLSDFGMAHSMSGQCLYGRGDNGAPFLHVTEPGEPAFLAVGLLAESIADLEKLAATEGAVVADSPEPGGGKIVRLDMMRQG